MNRKINFNKKIMFVIVLFLFLQIISASIVISQDEKPDLIFTIDNDTIKSLEELVEGEEIIIPVNVKNEGDKNITGSEVVNVGLKINGVLVSSNSSSNGLDIGETIIINVSWTPSFDFIADNQLLTVMVDHTETIIEKIEYNNIWDKYVNISEGETDLRITNFTFEKKTIDLDETIKVFVDVKNYGKSTSDVFQVKLEHVGGITKTKIIEGGLQRNNTKKIVFNWTLERFGNQILKTMVVFDDEIVDSMEDIVFVEIESLDWWDENYHYRHLIITKGFGNISYSVNFTVFFDEIGVSGVFDEKTIKIVNYDDEGNIKKVIDTFNFTKKESYDSVTNAKVDIIWNVTDNGDSRYFCIYFDLMDNNGIRSNSTYIEMKSSGDIEINKTGFIQGWDYQIKTPTNNSVFIINETMNIQVKTDAISENITAFFYHEDVFIKKIFLEKKDDEIYWIKTVDFFNMTGNWKIVFTSYDKKGYMPENISVYFTVRLIDIYSDSIVLSTNYPSSPKIFQKDIVSFTGIFKTNNRDISDVDFKISIYDEDEEEFVFNDTKTVDLKSDVDNNISFTWTTLNAGDYVVIINADYTNEIVESDEENNILEKEIKVNGLPDLTVTMIDITSEEIIESETAIINVTVENLNNVEALDYQIFLYVQRVEEDVMKYDNFVYKKNISIDGSEIKKIDLLWEDAEAGEWIIAVLINVSDLKRDISFDNNRMMSDETLIVRSIEKNPPVISNLIVNPNPVEQGKKITITVDVTDDNGIEYVKILITDPDNNSKIWNMTRYNGFEYIFIYDNTMKTGSYDITIKTKDLSIFENIIERKSRFTVREDNTDPILYYVGADPNVQLTFDVLDIYCIASDNIKIDYVSVVIQTPDNDEINAEMIYRNNGRYEYSRSYQQIGRYEYMITVVDEADNSITSEKKYFWITEDLNDRDNDGISDSWERLYSLDPENPDDADSDFDDDGFTNLEEYKYGFNPNKNLFSQNAMKRVEENSLYLSGSVLIFIFLLIAIIYLRRRKIL